MSIANSLSICNINTLSAFMRYLLLCLLLAGSFQSWAQTNLALSATPSASASSTGSFGPANWTNGLKNATTFGWVGTAATFPQPAWMQLEWQQPQTFNQLRLFNVGTNFQPPAGNGVVFSGSVQVQYWTNNAWQTFDTLFGAGSYGDSVVLNFNNITTTRLRLHNFVISGNHNPGFDEWEVYRISSDTTDLAVTGQQLENILGGFGRILRVRLRIANQGNVAVSQARLGYVINTVPETGPFEINLPIGLAAGDDSLVLHPETTPAEQRLNGRTLCMWVKAVGDSFPANDTLCIPLTGFGSSVLTLGAPGAPKAYPNPFSSRLMLEDAGASAQLELFDANGRRVWAGNMPEEGLFIPPHWPEGNYIVLLRQGEKAFAGTLLLQR